MKKFQTLLVAVTFGVLATTLPACSGDTATPTDAGQTTDGGHQTDAGPLNNDAGPHDAGTPDAGEPSCFDHPTTHYELINGCTDAVAIDKAPTLPLLPDGGLPALP